LAPDISLAATCHHFAAMAPRGSKRASTAGAGGAAKKRAVNPVVEKIHVLVTALKEADSAVLPKTAAQMLVGMLPGCFSVPSLYRHEFQASVVEMVGRELQTLAAAMERDVEEAKAKVDGVEDDRKMRQTALADAQAAIADLEAAVVAKKDEFAAMQVAQGKADGDQKEADNALSDVEASYGEAVGKKDEVKGAVEALALLKTASAESIDHGKQHIKQLAHVSKKYELDTTLCEAVFKALKKEVDQRQSFDVISINHFDGSLQTLAAKLTAELEAMEEPKARASEEANAKAKVSEEAKQACEAAGEALKAAKEANHSGHQAVKAAQKAVGNWLSDTKTIMDAFEAKSKACVEFRSSPLVVFEELRELQPEPEPVEEAPKEQEAEAPEVPEAAMIDATAAAEGEAAPVSAA